MKFGNDFILISYKGNLIKNFFNKKKLLSYKVKCIDTGKNTLTGGRLLRLKDICLRKKFYAYIW